MLRPYLRIRPAEWVQTRLERVHRQHLLLLFSIFPMFPAPVPHSPLLRFPSIHPSIPGTTRWWWWCIPRAGALAVGAGARVPDGFVRHFDDVLISCLGSRKWSGWRLGGWAGFVVVGKRSVSIEWLQPKFQSVLRSKAILAETFSVRAGGLAGWWLVGCGGVLAAARLRVACYRPRRGLSLGEMSLLLPKESGRRGWQQ